MVYFLVNNGYHYFDVECHLSDGIFPNIICVPHTIKLKKSNKFNKVFKIETPFISRKWLLIFPVLASVIKINKFLKPSKKDILFLYTEYDPINNYIAHKFKNAGAKIFLIEDGGVAGYIINKLDMDTKASLKNKFKELFIWLFFERTKVRVREIDSISRMQLNDNYLDGLIYYKPVKSNRDIPINILKRNRIQISKKENDMIFFDQSWKDFHDSYENYIIDLINILKTLTNKFGMVYFKFHPRQDARHIAKVMHDISKNNIKVNYIDSKEPIEFIINKYNIKFSSSICTSALLTLTEIGVQPIFLYKILKFESKAIKIMDIILKELGYKFIFNLEDINPSYISGIKKNYSDKKLIDFIDND